MSFEIKSGLKIRRALLSVSDKTGIVELAQTLAQAGAELVATGRTAKILTDAGLAIVPIEKISGSPEAFQGRMKTLSFPVCSGILYRRGDDQDERDLMRLGFPPIDCVVVNFYPFEAAVAKGNLPRQELIEEVDIGGPTLVRAAAKNVPDVLVLTAPAQYARVIEELKKSRTVSEETTEACAEAAWELVAHYDEAIARVLGRRHKKGLRYGENPHQKAFLETDPDGPVAWDLALTPTELSYNNILDFSACYALASDLVELDKNSTAVVVVKHNNPCGVALVPKSLSSVDQGAQKTALLRAWEGDPVSAFGGVLIFTEALGEEAASWLSERFVELVAAPGLSPESALLRQMLQKRKNLKAISIRRFGEGPKDFVMAVPGGRLHQTADLGVEETLKSVTQKQWPETKEQLARFGIAVCRALKSNSLAIVREVPDHHGVFQLVGAGQGQPNRVEALEKLAIPRAQEVLRVSGGKLEDCVLVSDAFFPFRDTVDVAHRAGIRWIVQPGGSIRDAEVIRACDEQGIAMVFTGTRHFRH